MSRKASIIVFIIIIIIIIIVGFASMGSNESISNISGNDQNQEREKINNSSNNLGTSSQSKGQTLEDQANQIKEIIIDADNFVFSSKNINIKLGETIRLTLNNKEGFHDLVIDEFNIATRKLNAGESQTIEFTPNRAGSFEYYCSVGNHRQMGMFGTLTVE